MPETPGREAHLQEAVVMRKAFRRIVWFLFALFIATYIDRINIAFAALSMNAALGLNATMFGFANSLFYAGYVAFEIPSNLMLAKVGARKWLSRIMVTIGITSALTIFAVGPNSLYVLRFLVGIAEAGFVPGVVLYLTYWFPRTYRARANAWLMIAMPATIMVASPISGRVLQMDGALGMAGWQWLFLLEAMPSLILGIVAYFYLTDRPADAAWLSADERRTLESALERDRATGEQPKGSVWAELGSPNVVMLTLAYFCIVTSLNTNATWAPQIIREFATNASLTNVGWLAAIAPAFTVVAMPLWSARSDRKNERTLHTALPMAVAAVGWMTVSFAEAGWLRILGLILVSVGAFNAMAVFWALSAPMLSQRSRAAGVALISAGGTLGSALTPMVVGKLRDLTGGFDTALWYASSLLVIGIVLLFIVRKRSPA